MPDANRKVRTVPSLMSRRSKELTVKDIEGVQDELSELWERLGTRGGSSDGVVASLREAILSRVLQPGQQFAEEDFAKAFGVSRTPVREAVLRLEAEGLVERLSRRGLVINQISPEEVLEIYEVRIALDALAAELASTAITPPEVAELRWINDRMHAAGEDDDYEEMARLNLEFHDLMARASRNSFLIRMVREVHNRVRRFSSTTFAYPARWQTAVEEHHAILSALEQGDGYTARQSAWEHMANAKKVRLKMVEEARDSAAS